MAFVDPQKIVPALNIQPGINIADFGVGAGYFAVLLADAVGDKGRVYAIDIQEELLTKARSHDHGRHDNIEFLLGDLEERGGSTLADNTVDMVVLSNTLFQFENRPGGLTEAHRILKPGGRLVLIDWSESFDGLGPQPEHVITKDEAMSIARDVGFTVSGEFSEAGDHHYGLILTK